MYHLKRENAPLPWELSENTLQAAYGLEGFNAPKERLGHI